MSLQKNISQTIEQIRNNPLNHNLRLKLLQLYCVAGQWQQAEKTLNQYLKLNPTDQQTRTLFFGNIACELKRLEVYAANSPAISYIVDHQHIVTQQKIMQQLQAPNTLNNLFLELHEQVQPNFLIQLNDATQIQDEFIDTDIRISHVFEIFEENRYTWVSLADIESVQFKPTEILTDLIWRRTEILLKNKQRIACFVPVRYPFTEQQHLEDTLLYARSTNWENLGDFTVALGQKTLSNTIQDIGILDIANIYSI